jgi:hypothetical protein
MRLIIAGSRKFQDYLLLAQSVDLFRAELGNPFIEVISGTAKGADQLGERYAEERGLHCERFPADWKQYGRSAGPIRNRQMAEYADALIAFWDSNKNHSGTWNMICTAQKLGLKVKIVQFQQSPQGEIF